MKIILPFKDPKKYPLTQRFGVKFFYHGKLCSHRGVDYGLPKMTPIIAPFSGVIIRTTPDRTTGYGKAVYVKSKEDPTIIAMMAHLNEIRYKKGLKVKLGDNIGYSGRSGFWRGKNGYHIHFELRKYNKSFDPLPFMKMQKKQEATLFNQDDASLKVWHGKYIVKAGDSLWKIAIKYYGTGSHYMEIFNANEDILKSPNLIHPGDVLRIPVLKEKGI